MTIEYGTTRREVASWYWYSLRHDPKHLASWLFSLLIVGLYVFVTEQKTGSIAQATAIASAICSGPSRILRGLSAVAFQATSPHADHRA